MLDSTHRSKIVAFLKNKQFETSPKFSFIGFPPVDNTDEQGLIGYGGKINLSHLVSAYLQGIFPWPNKDIEVPLWFAPNPRGIIAFENYKPPKSLEKFRKKAPYRISFNACFDVVIRECQEAHKNDGIWITEEMILGYKELFQNELAYSVECWEPESHTLVGGLYGVCLGNFFSAESMFYKSTNASKIALCALIEQLRLTLGATGWLDTQMITPVVESFGGQYIERSEFMQKLQLCNFELPRNKFFL